MYVSLHDERIPSAVSGCIYIASAVAGNRKPHKRHRGRPTTTTKRSIPCQIGSRYPPSSPSPSPSL